MFTDSDILKPSDAEAEFVWIVKDTLARSHEWSSSYIWEFEIDCISNVCVYTFINDAINNGKNLFTPVYNMTKTALDGIAYGGLLLLLLDNARYSSETGLLKLTYNCGEFFKPNRDMFDVHMYINKCVQKYSGLPGYDIKICLENVYRQ